jgi:hypothetical protein
MGNLLKLTVLAFAVLGTRLEAAENNSELRLNDSGVASKQMREDTDFWVDDIGSGFRPNAQSLTVSLGASVGVPIPGGRQHHDLALASITYGHILGPVVGEGHWYRGNWEGASNCSPAAVLSECQAFGRAGGSYPIRFCHWAALGSIC